MELSSSLSRKEKYGAVATALILIALIYNRLFYGVGTGEEPWSIVNSLITHWGGRWFQAERSIGQTASVLFSPLTSFYSHFFYDSGLILFVRHLHFALSAVVGYQLFLLLKHYCRWTVAAVFSAVAIVFIPNGIQSLTPVTMGSLLFGLAAILSARAYLKASILLSVLAGVSWVACVFSQPILLPALLSFWWLAYFLTFTSLKMRARFFIPLSFMILLASLPIIYFILSANYSSLADLIEYNWLLNNPGGLWRIYATPSLISPYVFNPLMILASVATWLILVYKKSEYANHVLILALFIFFGFGGRGEVTPTQILFGLLPVVSTVALWLSQNESERKEERPVLAFVIIPGIVGALSFFVFAKNPVNLLAVTGIFSSILSLALLTKKQPTYGLILATLIAASSVFHAYEQFPEEESDYSKLSRRIVWGPYYGIFTHDEKHRFIDQLQFDIRGLKIFGKKLVAKDAFPLAYLIDWTTPTGPTFYFGASSNYPQSVRELYVSYFKFRDHQPDVVLDVFYLPTTANRRWVYEDPNDPVGLFDLFAKSKNYKTVIQRRYYRILMRDKLLKSETGPDLPLDKGNN